LNSRIVNSLSETARATNAEVGDHTITPFPSSHVFVWRVGLAGNAGEKVLHLQGCGQSKTIGEVKEVDKPELENQETQSRKRKKLTTTRSNYLADKKLSRVVPPAYRNFEKKLKICTGLVHI
jgi:hypothetical protein